MSHKRGKRKAAAYMSTAAIAIAAATSAAAGTAPPTSVAPNTLPNGGQVVAGNATITQNGNTQTINQTTSKVAINWQSFSIGADGKVVFVQPGADSIALNRVLGSDASQIFGSLEANGQVFLINPNGVLFAKGAKVDAAGILASTRDMSVADFMAGTYKLSGDGQGQVVNQGDLTANGGYIALIGAQVINDGQASAKGGSVNLVAANEVTLKVDGTTLAFAVDQGTIDALIANNGLIKADGGRVFLTAQALDSISKSVVNNSGIVEAQSLGMQDGKIVLSGDKITLAEGSKLDASGETKGGTVLVGGGWQGKDASIKNASTVSMAPHALIDVSARQNGDGGTAVLWSEDYTGFYGKIRADGGANGGNGGKVETSSKNQLQALGSVDANAAQGAAGQWLLDPVNVTIAASNASGTPYSDTYSPTADSTILASSINAALNAGTSVKITTGSTGSSSGTITVDAAITKSVLSGDTPTLTLEAAGDIILNNTISAQTGMGRLNVVLTADTDQSGLGSVILNPNAKVLTNGGNFYAGYLTAADETGVNQKRGDVFYMSNGSLVDVTDNSQYGWGGKIDIAVNNSVYFDGGTLRNAPYTSSAYHNDGTRTLSPSSSIRIDAGDIQTYGLGAYDIQTNVSTSLSTDWGSIGMAGGALRIRGLATPSWATLSVSNRGGDTYIDMVTTKAFAYVNLSLGEQAHSTHDIEIMGDTDGKSHIRATIDGAGVTQVASGGISTAGSSNVTYTSVNLSSSKAINFASNAVDMGTSAYFSASATTLTGTQDDVADIIGANVTLSGQDVGTTGKAIELSDPNYAPQSNGGSLTVNNSGGSTFLKSLNGGYTNLSLTHAKAVGTHSILFSGGDHVNFITDGNGILTTTLAGGRSDGQTFGVTSGIDLTGDYRGLSLKASDGNLIFGDHSVDMGIGYFEAVILRGNATGVIAAQNAYNASNQVGQIKAADVGFSIQNEDTPNVSSIGAGGKDIQIEKGDGDYNLWGYLYEPSLSVSTYGGDVHIRELTQNHFRGISLSLGETNRSQSVNIDLKGADNISFTDDGSALHIDGSKVALSDYNRYYALNAGNRVVQIDGSSVTSGDYSVSARKLILNGDVLTNGGNINLSGTYGVDVINAVVVDSNTDRTGIGGQINLGTNGSNPYNGTISAGTSGTSLTLRSSSTDDTAGNIYFSGSADNRAGTYIGGLHLDADGASDGMVYVTSDNVLLNGDFSAIGKVFLGASDKSRDGNGNIIGNPADKPFVLKTAASGTGNAGSITLGGESVSHSRDYAATLNSSTSNGNGGDITISAAGTQSAFATTLTVNASGGNGGTSGNITLPTIRTTGAQTYTGARIDLYGDLTTSNAALTLNGAARLRNSVTLKTQGNALLSLSGAVSAAEAGHNLTLGSTSDSAALSLSTDNSGGAYINALTVLSSTTRALTLGGIATDGAQTYTGGNVTVGGALATNGGNISLSGVNTLLTSGNVSIDTDRAGGTNAAGQLLLGTKVLNGSGTLSIDTTADGGGANAALTLAGAGAGTAFSGVDIRAGNVTLNGNVKSAGDLTIEARGTTADLTIASTGKVETTGAANTITLAAGRNFLNTASANTGIVYANGSRYVVYSATPNGSTEGMTGYNKHYNQAFFDGATPSYAGSGNWFLYSIAPVISVTPNAMAITYGSADPSLTLGASNYAGFIDGDTLANFSGTQTLTLAAPVQSSSGHRSAGTYAYTLNGTLTDALGYQYAAFNETLTVQKLALTVSGLSAVSREYDGTKTVSFTGTPTAAAALSGDDVQVDVSGITGEFADKNVGSNKTILISGAGGLTGVDAANYTLDAPANLTADVTKKTLTISGSTVISKAYDGTTTASVTAGTLNGLAGTETLTVWGAGAFTNPNAGNGITVNAMYLLGNGTNGGLASNYQLAGEALLGDITRRVLTITGSSVNGKTYNGLLTASITAGTLNGLVNLETLSVTAAGDYLDKNAGTGKTVNATYTLGNGTNGGLASNYQLAGEALLGNIAQKTITVTASGQNKTYDGQVGADVTLASNGIVSGDTVTFTGNGQMLDKTAGNGKTLNVSGIASADADAQNYSFNTTAATTVDVAKKTITVTATGQNKTYDGQVSAGVTLASTGIVSGDTVTFTGTGQMLDKNAGNGKTLNVSGIASTDTDAQNYSFGTTAATTVDIAKKTITVTASGQNKTYDGQTVVGVTLASNGLVSGDTVIFSGTGQMLDKNAGTGKTVNVSGIASTNTDAANYDFNTTAATTVDVAKKTITVTASGQNKSYDGSTSADVTLASNGIVSGDTVTFTGNGQMLDKNAGTGKTVNVSGIASADTDAQNYSFGTTAATTVDVAKKVITVTATGQTKTYDGQTNVGVTLASNGIVSGDTVTFTGNGQMLDKNAGNSKTVNVSGVASTDADAQNYSFGTTAATTVDIARKTITVTATGQNKTYDGQVGAGVTLASNGILSGDTVTFTGTGQMLDKNAGTGKTVDVSGIASTNTDAANYDFNTTAATTVDVAKKTITVTASGQNKTYDGSTSADVTLASNGVVSGDTVTFTGNGQMLDKNAGNGKTVNVSGIASADTDAQNYSFGTTAATTVDIAKKTITVTATGQNKTYDGQTGVGVTLVSNGIVSGDTVNFTGTGQMLDKTAGNGKTVDVSGIASTDTDAQNYSFGTTAATTVDIARKAITVTATGQNKTYDGQTNVGVTLASNGIVSGDTVTFTGSGQMLDKNAGNGKTVTASISANGDDATNYEFNSTAATTVDIAKKVITVTATGQNKTYDGQTSANVTLASNDIVSGDSVTFTGTGQMLDKNAGNGKTVNVSGITGNGTDAGNYAYATTAATTTDVAKKTITVTATGQNKTYDGQTSANVTLASNDIVSGDSVSFSGTGQMTDKSAGNGKTVNVSGITGNGTDAGNYTYATTATTTTDVAKKTITVTATGQNKTYDGTTGVNVTLTADGIVAGDSVTFAGSGQAADKNAGSGKTVTATVAALGNDAANYAYNATATTTTTVAGKAIDVALIGPVSKTGDGKTDATLSAANYVVTGLINGESIDVTQTAGQFSDAMEGTNKTVSVSLNASNYAAGANTTLTNYVLKVTTLTANVGEIKAPTSQPYQAALASVTVPTPPAPPPPAVSTKGNDNGVSTEANTTSQTSVTPTVTKEALSFTRTFTIADGGQRLPAGVESNDSDQ